MDDIQKVLSTEQMKFNEECSKLQHDTHEKWMEVKRLTRELDSSKKECEGLRKQYAVFQSLFTWKSFFFKYIELRNMQILNVHHKRK